MITILDGGYIILTVASITSMNPLTSWFADLNYSHLSLKSRVSCTDIYHHESDRYIGDIEFNLN